MVQVATLPTVPAKAMQRGLARLVPTMQL